MYATETQLDSLPMKRLERRKFKYAINEVRKRKGVKTADAAKKPKKGSRKLQVVEVPVENEDCAPIAEGGGGGGGGSSGGGGGGGGSGGDGGNSSGGVGGGSGSGGGERVVPTEDASMAPNAPLS